MYKKVVKKDLTLEFFRKQIDECDKKIINALIKRFNVVKSIGKYKKENNIPVLNSSRQNLVIEKLNKLSKNKLPKNLIEELYEVIFKSARSIQK